MSLVAPAALPPSRSEARTAGDALRALIDSMQWLAHRGRSVLTELFGNRVGPAIWTHEPPNDARDPRTGYRWYYHAHAGRGGYPGEHGHFHLFSDPGNGVEVTHLLAISVDARGMPVGLLAPNRWVTDGVWRDARQIHRLLKRFELSSPRRLHRVHRWLKHTLLAFSPQVRALLAHRDARAKALGARMGPKLLEDRRTWTLSRCRLDLHDQAAMLDRALAGPSFH